jgi:hypothetical protein
MMDLPFAAVLLGWVGAARSRDDIAGSPRHSDSRLFVSRTYTLRRNNQDDLWNPESVVAVVGQLPPLLLRQQVLVLL